MHIISPTNLRKNLFQELASVCHGIPVKVKTRDGNTVIIPEREFLKKTSSNIDKHQPRINGEIIGDLDEADKELEQFFNSRRKS